MFKEQTNQYTLTADERQWILIWHPDGPIYKEDKDGIPAPLPIGPRSYFGRLYDLTTALIEKKARRCRTLEEVRGKLDSFRAEMKRINKLEGLSNDG